jgi:hypothetical protein
VAELDGDEIGYLVVKVSAENVRKIGPSQFEEAAKALLAASPRVETVLDLMRHRLQVVCSRTILDCLVRAKEPRARAALEKGASQPLAFRAGD